MATPEMKATGWFRAGMWLGALVILSSCTLEQVGFRSSMRDNLQIYQDDEVYNFSPLDSRYNLDPPIDGDLAVYVDQKKSPGYDPFQKYSAQTYRGDDGIYTRHYYLPPGRGKQIADLLVGHVPQLTFFQPDKSLDSAFDQDAATNINPRMAPNQILVALNAITDSRPSNVSEMGDFSKYAHATGNVSDLLIVKAGDSEMLMTIDSFLTSLLTELPLIEIKVRVVEVAVSDALQWGLENQVSKHTSSSNSFLQRWFNFYNTDSMTKVGNDSADFQGSLFNAWGLHDKLELNATFELLQRTTDADILSAPTVTVLNGHRAIIETGDRVPKQEIVATASSAFYTYKYEQTGVKLVIVPYLLPGNSVEVNVHAEVVAMTGRETFDTPEGTLSQPILSARQASTKVRIKDGQAFALGGLMSTSEFDIVTKLPLLGDIPILGYLFKSKNIQKVRSEIIFYIEPRVVKREDSWQKREGT
ncbi:MAG: type II and III secretion system protein [Planctomycetota bacterium]